MLRAKKINLGDDARLAMSFSASRLPGGSPFLPMGTEFALMEADTIEGSFSNTNEVHAVLKQGISLAYEITAIQSTTSLRGKFSGALAQDQAKVPAESQVVAVAILNRGGNLLAGGGISNAVKITAIPPSTGQDDSGWSVFGAGTGIKAKYDTGSGAEANISGISLVTGLARRTSVDSGNLVYGPFLEYGTAGIETHNTFSNQADISTTGDSQYFGAGFFAHLNYRSNFYAETSLRVGTTKVAQSSYDFEGFSGQNVNYDTSSIYYGAHLGLGYLYEIDPIRSLDFYGKYFWTHQDGDSATMVNAGDPYTFDSINSHRTQLGIRYNHVFNSAFTPYIGAIWEHEFDGKADYNVYNVSGDIPSIEGTTGVFEIGFILTNREEYSPFTLDFGLEATTGVREGFAGTVELSFDF